MKDSGFAGISHLGGLSNRQIANSNWQLAKAGGISLFHCRLFAGMPERFE
jgi:hypothetical protein